MALLPRTVWLALQSAPRTYSSSAAAAAAGPTTPMPYGGASALMSKAVEFEMEQSVPPYLFVFATGGIGSRDLGPRTRVYAEGGDEVLDEAAREFAGVEEMVKVGEALFGPYEWERFDLLVLPPSFPYGSMENPKMVFLTPTVIKGNATGAQVVPHS